MNRDCIRKQIIELAEKVEESGVLISVGVWNELRMNSFEREYLLQFVDNQTLIQV